MRVSHRVQAVLDGIDEWVDGIARTRDGFADQVHSATEHVHHRSRSDGHYLSTMARSITAMTRAKVHGESWWQDIYDTTAACARHVLMKTRSSERQATVDNLLRIPEMAH